MSPTDTNRGTAGRLIRVVHEGGIQHEVGGNDWQLDEAGGQRGRASMPYNHNRTGCWLVEAVKIKKMNIRWGRT